jgi:hypothetical protein
MASRSTIVETPNGQIERNRGQLQVIPNIEDTESETTDQCTETETAETPRRIMTKSRIGTAVSKPDRLAGLKGEMWHIG